MFRFVFSYSAHRTFWGWKWRHYNSGITTNEAWECWDEHKTKFMPHEAMMTAVLHPIRCHLSVSTVLRTFQHWINICQQQSQVVRCPLMDGVKCGWQSGDDKVVNCKSTKFASMEADPKGATECTDCIKITSPVCKHRDIWDYHQSGNIRVSVQSAEEALTQSVLLDRGGAWKRAGCLSESQYLQHNTTQRHVQSKPNRKWIVMC